MISDNNSALLALLADVLHDKKPDKLPEGAWPELSKELRAQTAHAMPAEYITELGLSSEEQMDYLKAVLKNLQRFHTLMREQERILALLEAEGIPAVILKGAAACAYYLHPENRCMGDIDLLVLPQDFEKAYDVLVSAGCTAKQTPDDYYRHICMKTENSVEVELHNYFSTSDNDEQNAALDEMLYRAIPSRVSAELCGYPFSMLPDAENGLVLLGHINQHLSTGLGLRQIIDWMYYVESVLDDAFWGNGFADMADRIGMKRLAIIVTAMCVKYLGLDADIHWCAYEPVCDELMEFILSHGNFGKKVDRLDAIMVSNMKRITSPAHLLSEAQAHGLKNWKASRKHPILKPFAWAYQLGRWSVLSLKKGVTADMLGGSSASAKEETELMKKLGVTRL